MAYRIGGPQATPLTVNYGLTWGSMRYPLSLNGLTHGASVTVFSRAYPVTTDEDYPKFFVWDSGSWFRAEPASLSPFNAKPSYRLFSEDTPETPPGEWGLVAFAVGKFIDTVTVDNQDFDELVGEAIDTDIGTFTITAAAHTPGTAQILQYNVPVQPLGIYDITGLTAI